MATAPTIDEFTSELRKRNISRPNLYYAEILPPGNGQTSNKLVSLWCHSAHTPHSNISTNDEFIEAGVRRKYAYDQDYQNLVLNFYADQDYTTKNFFDEWKNKIVPYNRQFNYPDNYTADSLTLFIVNQEGESTYEYKYSRIYPKTVQSIELSYTTTGAYTTFSVEFVFEDVFFTSHKFGSTSVPLPVYPKTIPRQTVNQEVEQTNIDIMGNITGEYGPINTELSYIDLSKIAQKMRN